MGTTVTLGRKESNVTAMMDGAASTAMVCLIRHAMFLPTLRLLRPYTTCITVCQTDAACKNFPIGEVSALGSDITVNMTCYQNGVTVRQNHQMCNVTS